MFSVRLRIPFRHIEKEFESLELKTFFDQIEPFKNGIYDCNVSSIIYMDSKTKKTLVKGEACNRRPIQGSLTFVINIPTHKKPVVAKWFVPKNRKGHNIRRKGHNIHIANGLDIQKILGLLQYLSQTYANYHVSIETIQIEIANFKMEILGIEEIPFKLFAKILEKNGYSFNYDKNKTPPKISLYVKNPKFTAVIFRTRNMNAMGLKIDKHETLDQKTKQAIDVLSVIFSLLIPHSQKTYEQSPEPEAKSEKTMLSESENPESINPGPDDYLEASAKAKPEKHENHLDLAMMLIDTISI